MRAPSISIQHSSTPSTGPGGSSVHISWISFMDFIHEKTSQVEDNSFPPAGFYLSETTPLSLHFGELRLPVFLVAHSSRVLCGLSGDSDFRPAPDLSPAFESFPSKVKTPPFPCKPRRDKGGAPTRSSRRFPSLPQQLLQHANPPIHMLLLQQKRRQEPHHRVLRGVKQHTLGQRRIHNRTRRHLDLNPLNQSAPAHLVPRAALLRQRLQLLLQIAANLVDVIEELFFLDNRQKLQRHATRQRTASKRRAMLPRRNRRSKFLFRQERPQRQPRRNWLRNRDNIRSHAKTLKLKHRPRAPQAALNLVENQRHFVTISQRAALTQKFHRALIDSALAENRLQHNRAGIVVHRRAQPLKIVLRHKRHVLQQRLKSLAMLGLPRQRKRAKRSPVVRTLQRHQPRLRLAARAMPCQPRQLDRALDRLRPAVLKKSAVQSRKLAQLLRQRTLIFVIVEIRNMHQLRRLLANRLHNPRMRMPQRIHSQPRNKVEIARSFSVIKKHALAPAEHDGITVVSPQQIFPL